MKISKLQVGQTVYSVERVGMGNTTMKSTAIYTVRIVEIDPAGAWVMASWNGNPARRWSERSVAKWRKDQPITVTSPMGRTRLATPAEVKQAKIDAVQPEGDTCPTHNVLYTNKRIGTGWTIKFCQQCRDDQHAS